MGALLMVQLVFLQLLDPRTSGAPSLEPPLRKLDVALRVSRL